MSEYISTKEVAKRLGITPQSVANWTEKGLIPIAIKMQRTFRYDWNAVEKAVQSHTAGKEQ